MRFDVYRVADRLAPFVVNVQADIVSGLPSRVVIPLQHLDRAKDLVAALHPVFEIEGRPYVLATHTVVSIPRQILRRPIASLFDRQDEITRALDILLTGF